MKKSKRIITATSAIFAASTIFSLPTAAAENPMLPAYQKLWSGADETKYPDGMANPKDLHSRFISEGQDYSWSNNLEKEINQSLNKISFGKLAAKSVSCRSTICEVMLKIDKASIKADADPGKELTDFASDHVYPIAQRNKLELTTVISSSPDNKSVGSLIYIYAPKS